MGNSLLPTIEVTTFVKLFTNINDYPNLIKLAKGDIYEI